MNKSDVTMKIISSFHRFIAFCEIRKQYLQLFVNYFYAKTHNRMIVKQQKFLKRLDKRWFLLYLRRDVLNKILSIMKDNITLPELELPQLRPRPSTFDPWPSKRVAHPEIQSPIEFMVSEVTVEDAAVARAEIELEGEVRVDEVFQTNNGIRTAFGVVAAPLLTIFVEIAEKIVPSVADASAHTHEPVQVAGEPSFVHKIRSELRRPKMGSIDITIFGTRIKLDSEVVADEGLVRNGLRGTCGHANAVFVGGLGVGMERDACEKDDEQNEDA